MPGTISVLQQFFFAGKPTFTEKDVEDLEGKVCLHFSLLTIFSSLQGQAIGEEIYQAVFGCSNTRPACTPSKLLKNAECQIGILSQTC